MHHLIKGTTNHFISEAGYVFKVENNNEVRLKIIKKDKHTNPYVIINGKQCDLLYLMIEYFTKGYKPTDRIKFTVVEGANEIPASSIFIKPFTNVYAMSEDDKIMFSKFRCEGRSISANARCSEKVSPLEVFEALKVTGFKCMYCDCDLKPHLWHLDHYIPLSKKGKNVFENLVPACRKCNLMKSSMEPLHFISHCARIVLKNRITSFGRIHFSIVSKIKKLQSQILSQ